ncbi:MAG: hypothetical protein AVDCRST_MAG51-2238 [uncultured Ramlibacter sp.]|uniref:Uncharacterized protein n=1 Tax=uncultured Ramlibacter sp. TaxID=260755 RepID=A0A6J4PTC1_9BURK|nr:MAG: hypothetical protein AVDCRST_MAG51-2238 [uncultured Ramlibacter sp.]
MSFELPTLRVALAGFTQEQQDRLAVMLPAVSAMGLAWEFGKVGEADAFWINGARTQLLADGTLRIASGIPAGRSIQINLDEVDRPVAFATPLPRSFEPAFTFDAARQDSVAKVVERMEQLLKPLVAQFCLASQILEQEGALRARNYHVTGAMGELVAVVNFQGEVGVLPTATPLDFDGSMWKVQPVEAGNVPDHFTRTTLSQLMWQYVLRSKRDVLPRRYRTEMLYFRRAPRVPQRMVSDSHLLVLRELAAEPGRFTDLQQRTGLLAPHLARDLAALYLVGAVTSNPRRATRAATASSSTDSTQGTSAMPSGLGSEASRQLLRPAPGAQDLTAPAPMSLE